MNIIETIRTSIRKHEESGYYGDMQDTVQLIRDLDDHYPEAFEIVHYDTEDNGRWTNWDVRIKKVIFEGETAYFKVMIEEGKTELQSASMEVVEEVIPKEVTVIQYDSILQEKHTSA